MDDIPLFCIECGTPYPWTAARLKAAKELADTIEGLSKEDSKTLSMSIDAIVKDTPEATVSATKFKNIIGKVKGPVVESFREILVDIASETAKKIIWPK